MILCNISIWGKDNLPDTRQFQLIKNICALTKTPYHGKITKYENKLIRTIAVIAVIAPVVNLTHITSSESTRPSQTLQIMELTHICVHPDSLLC